MIESLNCTISCQSTFLYKKAETKSTSTKSSRCSHHKQLLHEDQVFNRTKKETVASPVSPFGQRLKFLFLGSISSTKSMVIYCDYVMFSLIKKILKEKLVSENFIITCQKCLSVQPKTSKLEISVAQMQGGKYQDADGFFSPGNLISNNHYQIKTFVKCPFGFVFLKMAPQKKQKATNTKEKKYVSELRPTYRELQSMTTSCF